MRKTCCRWRYPVAEYAEWFCWKDAPVAANHTAEGWWDVQAPGQCSGWNAFSPLDIIKHVCWNQEYLPILCIPFIGIFYNSSLLLATHKHSLSLSLSFFVPIFFSCFKKIFCKSKSKYESIEEFPVLLLLLFHLSNMVCIWEQTAIIIIITICNKCCGITTC